MEPLKLSVFVKSIQDKTGVVVVEAANGGPDGPPFVRFQLPSNEVKNCVIGTRYHVTIEGDA